MKLPYYSIIIPTYNRGIQLVDALNALVAQSLAPELYEILIADDGSTDETAALARKFIQTHTKHCIYFLRGEHTGPAGARNRGIKAARGEILFFTDDDCVVPTDWMQQILNGFERYSNVVGVGGWYQPAAPELQRNYFQRYLTALDQQQYENYTDEICTNIFSANWAGNTANVAYRRMLFEYVGMFDETLAFAGAVDWEFKKRIQDSGHLLLYIPMFIEHRKKMHLKTFFLRFFNQGRGRVYMARKYHDLQGNPWYDITIRTALFYLIFRKPPQGGMVFAHIIAAFGLLIGSWYARLVWKPRVQPWTYQKFGRFLINRYQPNKNQSRITIFSKYPGLSKTQRKIHHSPFCSVIVPTYNRAELLREALHALVSQTLPAQLYEIIVVDDGSSDHTEQVVASIARQHVHHSLRYFRQFNRGPAAARNRGIREAKGEIIFFTDDDCTVAANWVETLLDGLARNPDVAGVGGWLRYPQEILKQNIFARYWNVLAFPRGVTTIFECRSNDPTRAFGIFAANTANLCLRRTIIDSVGGFRETFRAAGAEDTDLILRIMQSGMSLLYIPHYVTHHKTMTFWSFVRMCFNRGRGMQVLFDENHTISPELFHRWKPIGVHTLLGRTAQPALQFLGLVHFFAGSLGRILAQRPSADA